MNRRQGQISRAMAKFPHFLASCTSSSTSSHQNVGRQHQLRQQQGGSELIRNPKNTYCIDTSLTGQSPNHT